MKKRVFSLFLCIALCLSLCPTAAFADGEDGHIHEQEEQAPLVVSATMAPEGTEAPEEPEGEPEEEPVAEEPAEEPEEEPAEPTPEPAPETPAEPTAEPTPEPTAEPTPTPEPTAEPTGETDESTGETDETEALALTLEGAATSVAGASETADGQTISVMVYDKDNTTQTQTLYFTDFSKANAYAVANAPNGNWAEGNRESCRAVITLLADVTVSSGFVLGEETTKKYNEYNYTWVVDKSFSGDYTYIALDLNGHTLTAGSGDGTIAVRGNLSIKSSNNNGGRINAELTRGNSREAQPLTLCSGTVKKVTVDMQLFEARGGTVERLDIQGVQSAKLYGGTFGSIVIDKTAQDYLLNGYDCNDFLGRIDGNNTAFCTVENTGDIQDGSGTSLENVTVTPHPTCTYSSTNGKCACGRECRHGYNTWNDAVTTGEDGKTACSICGTGFVSCVVSYYYDYYNVKQRSVQEYHTTLAESFAYVENYSSYDYTIELLSDVALSEDIEIKTKASRTISLDLNGHSITGNGTIKVAANKDGSWSDEEGSKVKVINSETGGQVANLAVSGTAGRVWIESNAGVGTLTVTAGRVYMYGGTVTTLTASGGATNVIGGTVTTLEFNAGTVEISGGSFTTVRSASTGRKLSELLEKGKVFKNSAGDIKGYNAVLTSDGVNLSGYNVAACEHPQQGDDDNICTYCGTAKFYASVTIGDGEPTKYDSVQAAFNTANGKTATVTLLADVTGTVGTLTDCNITLDMDGKTWSETYGNFLTVGNNATLTVTGDGKFQYGVAGYEKTPITVNGENAVLNYGDGDVVGDASGGDLVVTKGTMNVTGDMKGTIETKTDATLNIAKDTNGSTGSVTNVNALRGTVNVDGKVTGLAEVYGGTVNVNSTANVATMIVTAGEANVTGGTIASLVSQKAVGYTGGTLDVEGGNITDFTVSAGTVRLSGGTTTNLTVSGGTLNVSGGTTANLKVTGGTVSLSGGTYTSITIPNGWTYLSLLADGCAFMRGDSPVDAKNGLGEGAVTVEAHTCAMDDNGDCACGRSGVASITRGGKTICYLTFDAALDAVQNGETIKLLADATAPKNSTGNNKIAPAVAVTLALNGKKLNCTGDLYILGTVTITDSSAANSGSVVVNGGRTVYVGEGNKTGTLTIQGGTFSDVTLKTGTLNISGGKITGTLLCDSNTANNAGVTISEGADIAYVKFDAANPKTITGGSIGTLELSASCTAANTTITGGTVTGELKLNADAAFTSDSTTTGSFKFKKVTMTTDGKTLLDWLPDGKAFYISDAAQSAAANSIEATGEGEYITLKDHVCAVSNVTNGKCVCGRSYEAAIAGSLYTKFAAALDAVSDGGTVTLLGDVKQSLDANNECKLGLKGKSLTIDLNGHNFAAETGNLTIAGALTITDSSDENTGSVKAGEGNAVLLPTGSSLTVTGGKIPVLTVSGGTLTLNANVSALNLDATNTGNDTIGTLTVKSGTVKAEKASDINHTSCIVRSLVVEGGSVALKDGVFGSVTAAEGMTCLSLLDAAGYQGQKFTFNLQNEINKNGWDTVSASGQNLSAVDGRYYRVMTHTCQNLDTGCTCGRKYVAKNTDKNCSYDTLEAALTAAQTNQTIQLLADVTCSTIAPDKAVTIDLNGHTITGTGDLALGDNLTIKDSTTGTPGCVTAANGMPVKITGSVTVAAGASFPSDVTVPTGGSLTVTGGTFYEVRTTGGRLTINGGTFGTWSDTMSEPIGGVFPDGGTVTVTGGDINSQLDAENSSTATVNISGGTIKVLNLGGTGHHTISGTVTVTGDTTISCRQNSENVYGSTTIEGGTFTMLTISSSVKTVLTLKGGSFNQITTSYAAPHLIDDCLPKEGYAYTATGGGTRDAILTYENIQKAGTGYTLTPGGRYTEIKVEPHTCVPGDTGRCACGRQLVLEVETGEETPLYLTTFDSDKLVSVKENDTIRLLTDVAIAADITMPARAFTLDLNGHTLSSSNAEVITIPASSTVTLTDRMATSGKLTAPMTVNGVLNITAAVETGEIDLQTGGKLKTTVAATIGKLSVYGDPKKLVTLCKDVTLKTIDLGTDTNHTLLGLLPDGCAFEQVEDGEFPSTTAPLFDATANSYTAGNGAGLKVVAHACGQSYNSATGKCACGRMCPHTTVKNGQCEACHMTLVAQIEGETPTRYATFAAAAAAAIDGDTITLLGNVEETADVPLEKSCTIVVGDYKLGDTLSITLAPGKNLKIRKSTARGVGMAADVKAKITVQGGATGVGKLTLSGVKAADVTLAHTGAECAAVSAMLEIESGASVSQLTVQGNLLLNSNLSGTDIVLGGDTTPGCLTIAEGGKAKSVEVKSGSTVTMTGGEVETMTIAPTDNKLANFNISGGVIKTLTLGAEGGTYTEIHKGLTGGSYGEIAIHGGNESQSLHDLLGNSCFFYDTKGLRVQVQGKSTQKVTVKAACTHTTAINENGLCGTCGIQHVARVTNAGGTLVGWYETLGEAVNNAPNEGTVTLVADIPAATNTDLELLEATYTIDLNGHEIDINLIVPAAAKVTLKGDAANSAVTGKITVETAESTTGSLTIESGSYSEIEAKGGALNVKGGKITKLKENGGDVQLSGGTFNAIKTCTDGTDVRSLLASGYAFKKNDAFVLWGNAQDASINDVEVAKCVHQVAGSGANCQYCNAELAAKLLMNGDVSYYTSFADAYETVLAGIQTVPVITLLKDCGKSGTARSVSKTFKLILGDHALEDTLDITANGSLTVANTSGGTLAAIRQTGGTLNVPVNATAKIQSLTVSGGTTNLSGGTYDSITVTAEGKTVGDLLNGGYAYRSTGDGTPWVMDASVQSLENVSVARIPLNQTSVAPAQANLVYGNSVTLTASGTNNNGNADDLTYQWYERKNGETVDITGEIGMTLAITPDAGRHIYGCKITCDGYTATVEATVEVARADIPSDSIHAPTENTGLTYNGSAQALIQAGSVDGSIGEMQYKLGEDGTYGADIPTAKNAGTYTVYYIVKGDANHNDTQPGSLTVTIDPLNIGGNLARSYYVTADCDKPYYNGQPQTPAITLKLVQRVDTSPTDTAIYEVEKLVKDKDFDCTQSVTQYTNAGFYTISFTGKGNYTGTMTVDWGIERLDAPDATGSLTVYNRIAHTYTVDLASLLPALPSGYEYGKLTYELKATDAEDDPSEITVEGYLDGRALTNGVLTLPVPFVDSEETGAIATLRVTVTPENYFPFTLTLNVSCGNRVSPIDVGKPLEGLTKDNVTGDDREALEKLLGDLDGYLAKNPGEGEKKELEELKKEAGELIERLDDAKAAMEDDAIGAADDIDASNAKPGHKGKLRSAKKAIRDALDTYGPNYTEAEKAALNEKLTRIDLALAAIEKAEQADKTDKTDKSSQVVKTGDEATPILWIVLIVMAVGCVVVLLAARKKKK